MQLTKSVYRGQITACNAYVRKEERSKIIGPKQHLKKLDTKVQTQSNVKEIMKKRAKHNEIENKLSRK